MKSLKLEAQEIEKQSRKAKENKQTKKQVRRKILDNILYKKKMNHTKKNLIVTWRCLLIVNKAKFHFQYVCTP